MSDDLMVELVLAPGWIVTSALVVFGYLVGRQAGARAEREARRASVPVLDPGLVLEVLRRTAPDREIPGEPGPEAGGEPQKAQG
jgi:hypothetical protein